MSLDKRQAEINSLLYNRAKREARFFTAATTNKAGVKSIGVYSEKSPK